MTLAHALWEKANIWPSAEEFIILFSYVLLPNLILISIILISRKFNYPCKEELCSCKNCLFNGAVHWCVVCRAGFSDGRSHGLYISWYKYMFNKSWKPLLKYNSVFLFMYVCMSVEFSLLLRRKWFDIICKNALLKKSRLVQCIGGACL